MYSAERMSETGKERPIPDVQEDEGEVALALEHSQNQIKKAPHPTELERKSGVPETTIYGVHGADAVSTANTAQSVQGGMGNTYINIIGVPEEVITRVINKRGTGTQIDSNVLKSAQGGHTYKDLEFMKRCLKELETTISSLRSAQTLQSKKQDWEGGEDNTDERIAGVLHADHDNECEMTDHELYVHLHQCDMSDVSDEDIQSVTDEEVFYHVVGVLACCNITPLEKGYGSDTFGINLRIKARQQIHKKDTLIAETEETIPDVKLTSSIKGGYRSGNPRTDLLDGVNSEKLREDCTTVEGGQHHLNDVRSGKLGDDCSRADSGRKQLDAAYAETLMEIRSKADSGQNAAYSESLREGCTKGDNPNMKRDLLLPSPVDPLIGLPGKCVEFTFDLRCIQSRPVRVITRHNVEKTVEIGKLHPLEIVQEVFTFLDSILTELGSQSGIRLESGFYAAHPESVSEVIRIDLRDIQNIIVRFKTKLNVELILQISAMKPPTARFQMIETFLSGMLLKDC